MVPPPRPTIPSSLQHPSPYSPSPETTAEPQISPAEYWDRRFEDAENYAWKVGLCTGAGVLATATAGFWYATKYRGLKVKFYTAGVITALATMVSSQMTIHSTYIVLRNEIQFEKRREAMRRAEWRRRLEFAPGT
ncbi:hypothetical protein BC832DRAFT_562918 [Gaertneriomyces semiglobifer]|nr:hypothetical protein BC832DRAFT_562918 [Gaertneriomyces semiglobifer]